MADVIISRVAVRGGSIRVLSAGAGPAVLYLHGLGDAGEMLPVLRSISAQHRVIRPDHPGFLDSDDLGASSVRDLASMHSELMDSLDIDDIDLIGCSLGGWIAAELALLIGDRARSLTLIDPAGLAGDGTAPDTFALDPDEVLTLTVHDPRLREEARTAPRDPARAEKLGRSRSTARRIAVEPHYMHDPTLDARLPAITVPTQVFWGREDGVIPVSYASSWTAALPQAELHVISSAGHLPHVERPDAVLRLLSLRGVS